MTALSDLTAGRPAGLSDEEAMFLDVVGDVADGEVEPRAREIDQDDRIPDDLLDLLWAQEMHAVAVPEDLGGGGARPLLALLVVERLAEASAATACVVGDRQAALVALAAGRDASEGVAPVALADAGDGVRCAVAGDALRLEGRVEHAVGFSDGAPLLVLGVDADSGPVAACVPGDAAIQALTRARTGLHGLAGATLVLEGVQAAAVATAGDGAIAAARCHSALARASAAIGLGRRAVADTAEYLRERQQFGRPLAEFGALRRMVADLAASLASAAALVHDVATRPSIPVAVAAQAARAATTAALRAADDAVQLHGGYGYVDDHVAERLLRDAVSLRALAGGRRQGTTVTALLDGQGGTP